MKKIMIVDDVAIIREPIAKALEKHGYESIVASGGEEALLALQRQLPDLILLDMKMPRIDGLAVLQAVRSDPRTAAIAVIMLTDSADREGIVAAMKLGICNYVLKSQFNLKALIERVEAALRPPVSGLGAGPKPADDVPQAELSPRAPSRGRAVSTQAFVDAQDAARKLKELEQIMTRAQLLERMAQCGDLKASSSAVAHLLALVSGADASIETICQAIEQDQALAVKVLKLANSVLYVNREPVDSIHKAVLRIGTNQVRQAVLNMSIIDRFGAMDGLGICVMQFWEHSTTCGLIAAQLTRSRQGTEAEIDAAFTRGLLHDVGRLVFIDMLGQQYSRVLDVARALSLPLEQVEARLLGANHAQAMEAIFEAWRLPPHLIKPMIVHHASPLNMRREAGGFHLEAFTLAFANRLAHALLLGDSGNEALHPIDEIVDVLKIEPHVINRIEHDTPGLSENMKLVFSSHPTPGPPISPRQTVRDRLSWLRPRYFGSPLDHDVLRTVCKQVTSDNVGLPNVGVVNARTAGEGAALLAEIQASEAIDASDPLPLVIFSQTPKPTLNIDLLGDRQVEVLPMSVTVTTLSQAFERLVRESAITVQ